MFCDLHHVLSTFPYRTDGHYFVDSIWMSPFVRSEELVHGLCFSLNCIIFWYVIVCCIFLFVCLYVYMFVCLYVCMFVCLYVCMFVCLYAVDDNNL